MSYRRSMEEKLENGADKGSGATPQQDASTETADDRIDSLSSSDPTPELRTYNVKLGWIQGVLIPCLLNIWGVMLFLRIAWIVAQAGTVLTTGIILFTAFVCVITALSLSAICTNGELKGGGVYYIVSRSLGAELGASLGIILAFANAVAASMNTIGFCDSLNELLKTSNLKIIDNGPNDVRIVGAISLCVMCVICAIGMDWESKVQNSLIVIIVLAIFTYIIGACIGPSDDVERSKGFVGINADTYNNNLWPDFRYSDGRRHDVFSVFAMFFPAMTGVQAGANICGDLRQPAKAIPKGTLLAIGISTISYLVMAWLCGVGAARDASGAVADVASGTLDSCKPNCQYGLHNHYTIMQIMAWSSVIIYAGCWAATLSTALTNLLSVPRLIQALGVDHIYPGLIFFSKPYGKHGEPYRGYVLTFFVSLVFVLIGELNTVAPLITNFYLASYALINFCTFHAALVHHINWRPTFKYYNTWLSLAGFMLCMFVMVVISWVMALLTILIFLVLFLIVLYRKPDVNWASSTDAQRYKDAVSTLVQLSHKEKNIKSYNPQVLVLAGQPLLRPALLDIGHMITRLGSFMIVADICEDSLSNVERMHRLRMGEEWLQTRGNRGFYVIMDGQPFEEGVRTVLRTSGLGHLKPNIMLIGFQNRWNTYPASRVSAYVRVIQLAYEQHLGLTILRVPETARPQQDPAPPPPELGENSKLEMHFHNQVQTVMHRHSDEEIDKGNQENPVEVNDKNSRALAGADVAAGPNNASGGKITSLSMRRLGVYRPLIFGAETNVDAWWLYDDGGLNILLPYIIARRGFKVKVPLRVFNLAKETNDLEEAEKRMVSILHEYRIEYSSLTMIRGLSDPPRPESKQYFKNLVKEIKERSGDSLLNESELQGEQQKTNRHLRLRELLIDHSFTASLIVLTLPVPRQSLSSAHLYMAWLEVLSKDLPPVLFVRGNDESVLGV